MPFFQEKPVVIEARQLTNDNLDQIIQWIDSVSGDGHCWKSRALRHPLVIRTLEGDHAAAIGDWIIKGVKGEFYPCKPDIFEMTYQPLLRTMTERQHPITVPSELLAQWRKEAPSYCFETAISREEWIAAKAAQWGADQELDACCDWLLNSAVDSAEMLEPYANALRAARRPKPPSLKEQALDLLEPYGTSAVLLKLDQLDVIRRALESLPEQ